ncbi:MAG: hypothetical protein J7647_06045 [Cyanobacteria bacterium SBLK]|nr:hypothetical protein [Cyanobacteria bacterium SBLK]
MPKERATAEKLKILIKLLRERDKESVNNQQHFGDAAAEPVEVQCKPTTNNQQPTTKLCLMP